MTTPTPTTTPAPSCPTCARLSREARRQDPKLATARTPVCSLCQRTLLARRTADGKILTTSMRSHGQVRIELAVLHTSAVHGNSPTRSPGGVPGTVRVGQCGTPSPGGRGVEKLQLLGRGNVASRPRTN